MKWNNSKLIIGLIAITLIAFLVIRFYPMKLTIIVPKGYRGEINLVLSNVEKDILTVDSNGIGYITKRTFDKTHQKPTVLETDGTNVSSQCVGFNPSTFWAVGKSSVATKDGEENKEEIKTLSFELVPEDKQGQKQYYNTDLIKLVDRTKLYVEE